MLACMGTTGDGVGSLVGGRDSVGLYDLVGERVGNLIGEGVGFSVSPSSSPSMVPTLFTGAGVNASTELVTGLSVIKAVEIGEAVGSSAAGFPVGNSVEGLLVGNPSVGHGNSMTGPYMLNGLHGNRL